MALSTDASSPRSASAQPAAAALLLVGALVLGIYAVSVSSLSAMAAGTVFGAASVVLLPRNALPSVALWALVLFPGGYIQGVPVTIGRYLTPAVLVIAVWVIRLALAQRMTLFLRAPIRGCLVAAPLLMLLFASAVFSMNFERTSAWLAVFVSCVIAPALIGQTSADDVWPSVRSTLAGIGLFLGLLASSDYFLHYNPWTAWYAFDYSWTSGFRTSTSLGHPLTTALVSSVAIAACLFPSTRGRQWPYWICAIGAVTALVLTVSRTSVIAVGVSALVGIAATDRRVRDAAIHGRGRLAPLMIACTLFASVALSPLLSHRSASEEGSSSAFYRSQLFDTATELIAERPLLGFGPGTSALPFENTSPDGLENSGLQMVVSNGVPAFVFFLAGLAIVVIAAVRRSRPGVAAGIVAFSVSATGFNVVDSNPAIFALLAPLIVCAVAPSPRRGVQLSGQTVNERPTPTTRAGVNDLPIISSRNPDLPLL